MVTGFGDTIHIPNLSNLSANDKTASAEVTLQTFTETDTTINLNKHKEASFLIEDIVKVQANYNLMAEYTQKAGFAIAKQIDTDLLSEYSNLTTTDVGDYGTDISDGVILEAINILDLNDVPDTERYIVLWPTQKNVLMGLDKFVKSDYIGQWDRPTPVRTGANSRFEWGEIYGIRVYYTNNVQTTAGSPTQYHNLLFHKEAFALALQQAPRTQSDYILEYLGNLVVVDTIYGLKTIRADFGVEIRS